MRSAPHSRPLRVVIVSRLYAPEPAAATFRLSALERELARRGCDLTVLTTTPAPGSPEAMASSRSVRVRRWPALRNREGYVRGYLPYLSFDLPVLGRLLATRRPDVIVVEPPPTTGLVVRLAAWLKRVPYVYYAADIWSVAAQETGAPTPVTRLLRWMERAAWRGASPVMTVYPSLVEGVRAIDPEVAVALVGHGADTAVFRPDGEVPSMDGPYLVYAGTASEVHGAGIFIDALPLVLARIPDARLVVIGQGEDRPAMERAARSLPDGTVTFLPRLDPATTASWIRGARASLASVRPGPYGFALATKVFAAAACGTPVVYVGAGEGRELVSREALGAVVDYEVGAVADAMVAALRAGSDASRRDALVRWAHEHGSIDAAAGRAADTIMRTARATRGAS